jgi:hypothetical protein
MKSKIEGYISLGGDKAPGGEQSLDSPGAEFVSLVLISQAKLPS